ncbi:MAG: nucleotidyl transferase AbiEii/AbiGii toxin family protein [Myxococcales bacterium]|nr:nucleotidyl transferase AbiEii/AbiGii toxin family protein [Myxococcales bacterium]
MDGLDDALRVIASLNQAGVDYIVVGGVALNLHGLVRATEDLDLFVRPDPENVERLRRALRAVWDDPEIEQITAEDLCGDYPVVRYGPPEGTLYLDILTRVGEATQFSDLRFQEKEIEGVRVRVATPATLYRMKKDTVRPIDRADVLALRSAFDLEEED